jgi:nicotinamidase-related amidase
MPPYVTVKNISSKAKKWLNEIAPYNLHKMELDTGSAALLVIDMQRYFLDADSPVFTAGGAAIIPNIRRLIEAFRIARRPVIFTTHVHHPSGRDAGILGWWWDGMIIEGTPEAEITDELAPLPAESIIRKHRYSAFYNTDLEIILRGLKVKDIVITGVMTNLCCETTARDAYIRDFRVFFPADCNGAACEEMQLATLINLAFGVAYITTTEELLASF